MDSMGIKIDQFDIPVCNSFKAKILNDQLCYEVDLNKYSNKSNIDKELKVGFTFIMDYNEDRQVTLGETNKKNQFSLGTIVSESNHNQQHDAFIYIETIGEHNLD